MFRDSMQLKVFTALSPHIGLIYIKVILTQHLRRSSPLLKKNKYGKYIDPSFHLNTNNISYHIITKYSLYSGLHTLPGAVSCFN